MPREMRRFKVLRLPADYIPTVMLLGLPPNAEIFSRTHLLEGREEKGVVSFTHKSSVLNNLQS
jgi:hypothetical protein